MQTRALLKRHQEAGTLASEADLEATLDLLYGAFYFRLMAGHASLTAAFAGEIAKLALSGLAVREG